ncbi:hypothetical protein [Taibaiella koreensis]|uniref:hypothetical protein n=1 Tax=Taibaiella koreensis TaxID=1268548 RepID=UPI000E59E10A|nr:hypothetical protein [Taibaiella koreensis]
MGKLTKEYVAAHRNSMIESSQFEQSIFELILDGVAEQVGDDGVDEATVTLKFLVRPNDDKNCIYSCTINPVTGLLGNCVHILNNA